MNEQLHNEKPCLVPARQGFSVLYNNRYLYSRYQPDESIEKVIDSLDILPETLVLVFSPLLCYGLKKLIDKTQNNSFILLIEKNKTLFEFSESYIQSTINTAQSANNNIHSICPNNEAAFCELFQPNKGLLSKKHFRRCITIELSGGAKLNEQFYKTITSLADNIINQFWRNRITLVKLGRLYARNIMRNLARLPESKQLKAQCINRPILVCGSGLSIDTTLPKLRNEADRFFVISVDNALMPLLKHGIIPDAVLAVESQLANEQAFIGATNTNIPIIADLTSRPHVLSLLGGTTSFFLTRYENMQWLNRIHEDLFQGPVVLPLGSVGLTAMDTAIYLRADSSVPIFFCGLDFSYIPFKSHCREAPAHRRILDKHTRLDGIESGASFSQHTFFFTGKNNQICISDPSLAGYGKSFSARYPNIPNIYDISDFGFNTGCPQCSINELIQFIKSTSSDYTQKQKDSLSYNSVTFENILSFYKKEKEDLIKLRSMLIEGGDKDKILELIKTHEYLYIHFPDGYKEPSDEQSFLTRVRSEIDFFLKDIEYGCRICKKLNSSK